MEAQGSIQTAKLLMQSTSSKAIEANLKQHVTNRKAAPAACFDQLSYPLGSLDRWLITHDPKVLWQRPNGTIVQGV